MIETRKATPEDIANLRPLMEEWIAECNPDGMRFDPHPERLLRSFRDMAAHPGGTAIVMLKNGALIGCIGLVKHGWGACLTENFASENLWYVKRSEAGYARTLVAAAKAWAAENGCDYLLMSANRLSTARAEKGDEFLAVSGFRPLYQLHICEVGHV